MPSQGPRFPATGATLANAGTSENAEAWVNPGNIVSDDATNASITAATYDSPDISQLLIGSNFGFTIPNNAGIVGIVVELERNNAAGAASDNRVQLAKGTTFADLVGNNKADTALDWPAAMTVASYGSASDLWGATWTPAEINASSFAVFMSVQADAANTDVAVDFYRVTVHYVEPTSLQLRASDTRTFPPGRLMPRQTIAPTAGEPAAAPVVETPTPGGAIAAGVSPIAVVAAVIAGAIGGGAGPSAQAVAGQGGSPASGFAVNASVPVSPGGATGNGTTASALVPVTPGGATAGGFPPIVPIFETPPPGGAIAGGVAPSAVVPSAVGASTAGGTGPNAAATSAAGGAIGAGTSPTSRAIAGTGGAIGGGTGASAQAVAGQGGSPASGFAPNSAALITPGGAIGQGVSASALVPVIPGGAIAGGRAPSEGGIVVPVLGHFDEPTPAIAAFDEPTYTAAFFDEPTPSGAGTLGGMGDYGSDPYGAGPYGGGEGAGGGFFDEPTPS